MALPAALSKEALTTLLPARSLYDALQEIPDPRRRQGKRYSLALLVCLIFLAKLVGQTTMSGATEWVRHRGDQIAEHFGLSRTQMPCQIILARIDVRKRDELLAASQSGFSH